MAKRAKAKKAKKAEKAKAKKAKVSRKRAARRTSPKKAKARKAPAKARKAKKASPKGHPDKRVPVGDGVHEILYKWDAAANQYRSKEVPIGGDWAFAKGKKAKARKARPKKAVAKKAGTAMAKAGAGGHPDRRVPVGDGVHEILYKWDAATNQYRSKEVLIGEDWS